MSGQGSSCGACKFLRRKCSNACVFAPFFCYEQSATHFAAIHKIFGASNVSKLLSHLPFQNRSEAAITICYEAHARIRDPTYGCVAHIFALQQQVASLQEEIETLAAHVVPPAANNASWGYDQTLSGNIPLQQDAVDLRQLLDQQVPVIAGAANFNSDGFFYGEKNQVELLPLDKEALDTWDPSCSILSNDFINEQCSLENFYLETVPQEAWHTNSTWCDGVNYQDY